jgi:TIR domain
MYAFLSYQNADKKIAAKVVQLLTELEVPAFLAHEDIEVSEEWRAALLRELRRADIFVAILTERYHQSIWCVQEAGIAALRRMTVVPLSVDGTNPKGFLAHVQAKPFDPDAPNIAHLVTALAKRDFAFTASTLIGRVRASRSWRQAEAQFELVLPYLENMSNEHIRDLLIASAENGEVCHASLCAKKYLPPLVKSHGHLLNEQLRRQLIDAMVRNGAKL